MATRQRPTDVVIIGLGATGGVATLPLTRAGLNVVGLKRRKFSRIDLHRIRDAYQMLFFGEDTFAERLQRTGTKFSDDPVVGKMVSFIREGGKRPPMMPALSGGSADSDAAP